MTNITLLPPPGHGLLLALDGTSSLVTPAAPKKGFRLAQLYELLDCRTIEVQRLRDGPLKGALLIFDEEGSFVNDGAEVNAEASRLWRDAYPLAKYPHNNTGTLWGRVLLTHDDLLK